MKKTGTLKDLKKDFKKYKDFFYPVLIFVILLFLLKFFFMPKINEIISLRRNLKVQENKVQELTSYLDYLQDLAKNSLEIEEKIVNSALPEEKDIISLIITFEGLGKVEGIELAPLNIKPGLISKNAQNKDNKTKNSNKIYEINFKMTAKAENTEVVKRFLDEIYLSRRTLAIKDLRWSYKEDSKETGKDAKIELDLSVITYYYPQPKVKAGKELVQKGKSQEEFLRKLKKTKVYEDKVLKTVPTGKENLFKF